MELTNLLPFRVDSSPMDSFLTPLGKDVLTRENNRVEEIPLIGEHDVHQSVEVCSGLLACVWGVQLTWPSG